MKIVSVVLMPDGQMNTFSWGVPNCDSTILPTDQVHRDPTILPRVPWLSPNHDLGLTQLGFLLLSGSTGYIYSPGISVAASGM